MAQTPLEWLNQFFDAEQAKNGGVIRRNVDDMHKHASYEILLACVIERRFHLDRTRIRQDNFFVIDVVLTAFRSKVVRAGFEPAILLFFKAGALHVRYKYHTSPQGATKLPSQNFQRSFTP